MDETTNTKVDATDLMQAITFLETPARSETPMAAMPEPQPEAETPASAPESKLDVAVRALKTARETIDNVLRLLGDAGEAPTAAAPGAKQPPLAASAVSGRVVEGVFDGRGMVGGDGQQYAVPPNYASKSKLVEGDMLKLTVTPSGAFIYKQVGPVERDRVTAALGFDETTGEYYAATSDQRWSVLRASVTYYKGEPGDSVVLLVPKAARSAWAAVENVMRKTLEIAI